MPAVQTGALPHVNLDESPGAKPVGDQLQATLKKNATKVLTLFEAWDENGDGGVSRKEFHRAMKVLGLDVKAHIIDALFCVTALISLWRALPPQIRASFVCTGRLMRASDESSHWSTRPRA